LTYSKGHTNFFAGNPLNRLAWLRTSPAFLNAVVKSPETRWVLFNEGKPLLSTPGTAGSSVLARLSTRDVRGLLGPEPYFSQAEREGETAAQDVKELQAARLHGPPVVFLGLHEHQDNTGGATHVLPSSEFSGKDDAEAVVAKIRGTPYFSLDVSGFEETRVSEVLGSSEASRGGTKLEFMDGRAAMNLIDQFDSGIFSTARTLVDWTARNKVSCLVLLAFIS
jgi:NAD+ diphosphatase